MTKFEKAVILGATGPTGRHLARILRERDQPLRAVSRSASNLEACFPGDDIEKVAADATDDGGREPFEREVEAGEGVHGVGGGQQSPGQRRQRAGNDIGRPVDAEINAAPADADRQEGAQNGHGEPADSRPPPAACRRERRDVTEDRDSPQRVAAGEGVA